MKKVAQLPGIHCTTISGGDVFGPLTALIATLAQYRWFARSMDKWYGLEGFVYRLAQEAGPSKFIDFVCSIVYLHIWANIALYEGGCGLDSGPHPASSTFLKDGWCCAPKQATTLEVKLAGCYWPPDMVRKAHPETKGRCPRCWADDADIGHMLWTCPAIKRHEHPAVNTTQGYATSFVDEPHLACFFI